MGKIEVIAPYVRSTPSGYYWEPSRRLKRLGFHPETLGKDAAAAIVRAAVLNAAAAEEARRAVLGEPTSQHWPTGSMGEVIELWRQSDAWAALTRTTQQSYARYILLIETWCGRSQPEAVTRKAIKSWQRALTQERGPVMASAILRVLSVVMSFALDEDRIKIHPAQRLKLKRGGGDEEPWLREEIAAFCAMALERGRPSMRLAALLMAGLGQRQGDVRRLARSRYDKTAGVFDITQSKRGRRVLVPVIPELREAIDAAPMTSPVLVVSEITGRPYTPQDFRYQFRRIADAVGLPKERKSMTLRHTMGTMLGEAGCTESEVISILGNLPEVARKHYIRPSSAMAERAMAKFTANRTKKLTDV